MTERDPHWKIAPDAPAPAPQNPAPAPISPAKRNRDFADDVLQAAREEMARQEVVRRNYEIEERLRQQIRAIDRRKDTPRPEDRERLLELTREHYRRTGASGRGG